MIPILENAPIRVLIAEDNEVNQDLARRCFERLGCQADIATDGMEAVEALQRTSYDVVFMDCQMPNLDGFDASRRIRALERERPGNEAVPIVALTASVTAETRDACLAAGMNDCITKPFTMAQLRAALCQWAAVEPGPKHDNALVYPEQTQLSGKTAGTPNSASLDLSAIEALRALETPDNPDACAKIIHIYLKSSQTLLDQLNQACDCGNADGVAVAAHSLKSSSANMGAVSLSKQCQNLEAMAGQGDLSGAAMLIAAVQDEFDTVRVALEREMLKSVAEN